MSDDDWEVCYSEWCFGASDDVSVLFEYTLCAVSPVRLAAATFSQLDFK